MRILSLLRAFVRHRGGVSAVEFAFVAPVLLLALGCVTDMGLALRTKFNLSNALSVASSYALNSANATPVTSSNGAALASTLASLLSSANAANWANASVIVNNGPTATVSNGAIAAGGVASGADSCYCPTGAKASLVWGAPVTCGATCGASGALAGKFIVLTTTRSFTPLILPVGLIASPVTDTSVVQVQ